MDLQKFENLKDYKLNEIWKDIPNYEGYYKISNLGNIKSLQIGSGSKRKTRNDPERILKPIKNNKNGYMQINLCKNKIRKTYRIHRLVMLSFYPKHNFINAEVNHINGIIDDNRLENLEWCTHKENMEHAVKTGLKNHKGEKHPNCKLTEKEIIKIRYEYKNTKISQRKLAKKYNVGQRTICDILYNISWTHIL